MIDAKAQLFALGFGLLLVPPMLALVRKVPVRYFLILSAAVFALAPFAISIENLIHVTPLRMSLIVYPSITGALTSIFWIQRKQLLKNVPSQTFTLILLIATYALAIGLSWNNDAVSLLPIGVLMLCTVTTQTLILGGAYPRAIFESVSYGIVAAVLTSLVKIANSAG